MSFSASGSGTAPEVVAQLDEFKDGCSDSLGVGLAELLHRKLRLTTGQSGGKDLQYTFSLSGHSDGNQLSLEASVTSK